jgi:hypothetical protein
MKDDGLPFARIAQRFTDGGPAIFLPAQGLQMHDPAIDALVLKMEKPVFPILQRYPCPRWAINRRIALMQHIPVLPRTRKLCGA